MKGAYTMNKKWMIKLGIPIIALAFISACNTTNDDNDNVPQDTNAPGNEDLNYENTRYNNQDINTPENDVHESNMRDEDHGIQRKSRW